jgi:uncharacterized damage-inducible protein DinB
MDLLSRRRVLKGSSLAAIGLCMPEIWAQANRTGAPAPVGTASSSRVVIEQIMEALHQSRAYTLECAAAMPENKYNFRPVPEVRSFGQQMVHIAEANGSIMQVHVEGNKHPSWAYSGDGKERVTSKADAIAQLNAAYDYVEKGLAQMTDDWLWDRVKTEMGEFSKYWGLHLILDHATHHRGQGVIYLRLSGIKPPEYRA